MTWPMVLFWLAAVPAAALCAAAAIFAAALVVGERWLDARARRTARDRATAPRLGIRP